MIDKMERETGLEPATSSLGSWHSTTELLPLSRQLKYRTNSNLRATPKSASLRILDSTVSRTWHSIKNHLRHADELAQNENGQYATSAAAHLKLLIGERHVSLMFTPPFSISK